MSRVMMMAAGGAAAALLGIGLGAATPASASTGWAVQHVPKPTSTTKGTVLASVSCVSATTCTAVGSATINTAPHQFVGALYAVGKVNGGSWTVQTVPDPADYQNGGLNGVSCTSASSCIAVGQYETTTNVTKALAERWNGTSWTVLSVPDPATSSNTQLYAVSCSAADTCMAVGTWTTGGDNGYTLAELWNGTSWTIVPTPTKATDVAVLDGVSCPSGTSCVAVGINYVANPAILLAERWNGSAWTAMSIPQPAGGTAGGLQGVSCSAPSACTTVGFTLAPATAAESGLAERWNGTHWSIQSVPAGTVLAGVSCPSAGSCTAVGEPYALTPPPAVDSWSPAGGWVAQTPATPTGATVTRPSGVSCQSATTCTASGYYDTHGNGEGGKPLAEHE
jgi:hypothetical protein